MAPGARGERPALLFITPIMPALGGNGLAMRAGAVLEALADDYEVDLLVVRASGPREPEPAVRAWCARIAVHDVARSGSLVAKLFARVSRLTRLGSSPPPDPLRLASETSVRAATALVADRAYAAVHVFRLYLAPFAGPYFAASGDTRPSCRLDLDDRDATAHRRLAALLRETGDEHAARAEAREADRYQALERALAPRFDVVYVASERDRLDLVSDLARTTVAVLPNAVRAPERIEPPPSEEPFTFLFVGNLSYRPNEDAMVFFCAAILPLLRRAARRPCRVRIVGAAPTPRVRALASYADVTVVGPVADVAPCYRDAHAVIVPLRAGGGTRIKILEAFAYGRPVVSTTIGAEGLDVEPERHLVIADSAADFAAACVRVTEETDLARRLVEEGRALVRDRHRIETLRKILRPSATVGPRSTDR